MSPHRFDSGSTIGDDVADLDAVLRSTGGGFVFGLSSGADIVLEAALTLPSIERIALYEPAVFPDGIPAKGIKRFNAYAAAGDLPGMLVSGMKLGRFGPAVMRAMPDRLLKPVVKRIMKAEEEAGTGGYASMAELAEALPYDFAIAQSIDGSITKFKNLSQPVLLLGGSKSPRFLKRALDQLAQIIPNVTRVEINGADHAAAWNVDRQRNPRGNPRAVADELKAHFTAVTTAATAGGRKAVPQAEKSAAKR